MTDESMTSEHSQDKLPLTSSLSLPDVALALGNLQVPTQLGNENRRIDILCLARIDPESRFGSTGGYDPAFLQSLMDASSSAFIEANDEETLKRPEHDKPMNRMREVRLGPWSGDLEAYKLFLKAHGSRGVEGDGELWVTDWYLARFGSHEGKAAYDALSYDAKADVMVDIALRVLSVGKIVVTDRLHAHILCLQMSIPHICIDNTYGKFSLEEVASSFRRLTFFSLSGKLSRYASTWYGASTEASSIALRSWNEVRDDAKGLKNMAETTERTERAMRELKHK